MMGVPFNFGSVEAAALASQLPELPQELQRLVAQADAARFQAVVQAQPQHAARSNRSAFGLLELAHAALQLGLVEQADGLVLEADALHPIGSWCLIAGGYGRGRRWLFSRPLGMISNAGSVYGCAICISTGGINRRLRCGVPGCLR